MEHNGVSEIILSVLRHEFSELPENELKKLATQLQKITMPGPISNERRIHSNLPVQGAFLKSHEG